MPAAGLAPVILATIKVPVTESHGPVVPVPPGQVTDAPGAGLNPPATPVIKSRHSCRTVVDPFVTRTVPALYCAILVRLLGQVDDLLEGFRHGDHVRRRPDDRS